MSSLKPYGMAVIIAGPVKQNIGRYVTTIRHIGEQTSPSTGIVHDCWKIMAPPDRPLYGYDKAGNMKPAYYGPMPTAWLMPVDDADPDAVAPSVAISETGGTKS